VNDLEIIHLRSSGEPIETLAEWIRESIGGDGEPAEVVTLFRRRGLDTDVAVHIRHAEPRAGQSPSEVALRLAAALRTYGIVEHAVWEEM
jgi:hypothetical protein